MEDRGSQSSIVHLQSSTHLTMDPVKITIDGKEVVTAKGKTVIQAAAEAGVAIPHYCYHSKLSIAGNCRMCLVEIEKMPKLQIACNTQVAEGMGVLTQSPKVLAVRKAVLEFLLINHPVDCPICDQAGECQLQNYYMEHNREASRFEVGKQHDRKKTIFGPNVIFDGERCIKCTRCVRFCQEITKTDELAVINRGDHSTIALFNDQVLDNPLSANVVDICPVGALTDRDFRFKVRVWYLQKTPSVCPGCSTGCNISVETYQNQISRFKPRVNEAVNSHWICDEGRYCFHELTGGQRLTTPLIRQEGGLVPATWEDALQTVLAGLRSAKAAAGILSGRSTNEEAFLFAKLMKKLAPSSPLEVCYQERELSETQKVLMSPDRAPNFRGARDMGVGSNGGYESLLQKLLTGDFSAAYVVGEELIGANGAGERLRAALQKLSFLVVQDIRLSETAKLAHVVLPATHFGEKEGTYTNRKGRVQKLNAAVIAPESVLQDWQTFLRLLDLAGEKLSYSTPAQIFQALAGEVALYRGISYATIGDQGIQLGGGGVEQS
ncbi:MAG: molybdopterin-dependent oxidoreductase [Deltaproteobacteria bacterium]|nr:molybdopterin-dependent oxidoreductase [Deltaproteobacteria bacterium]